MHISFWQHVVLNFRCLKVDFEHIDSYPNSLLIICISSSQAYSVSAAATLSVWDVFASTFSIPYGIDIYSNLEGSLLYMLYWKIICGLLLDSLHNFEKLYKKENAELEDEIDEQVIKSVALLASAIVNTFKEEPLQTRCTCASVLFCRLH